MKKLLLLGLLALGALPGFAQTLYDDFETTPGNTRIVTYRLATGGTLIQNQLNPGGNAVNGSATCARYIRNAGAQYDNFDIETPRLMADVTPYVGNGATPITKVMTLKFYSPAVGIKVLLVLQNKAKNRVGGFPNGRLLGEFEALTTVANQWETLTFSTFLPTANDASVTRTTVDEITVLIAPNTFTGQTFHFDNIMGPELVAPGASSAPAVTQLYDDFETTRKLRFTTLDGSFAPGTTNPSTSGNASSTVGQYVRSANAYDTFEMAPANVTFFDDVAGLASIAAAVHPTLKIYSPAAGTAVQLVFSNLAKRGGYPTGVHSLYTATTSVAGGWQTLSFNYVAGTYDASTKGTEIDRIQLQIAPNTTATGTYYLDDITLPAATIPVARLYENFNDTRKLTYGVRDGVLTENFNNPSVTGINPNPRVGKYVRSANTYDTFYAALPGQVDDITDFFSGPRKLSMRVYCPEPVGTGVTLTFVDASATASNYPTGRHSYYYTTTTAQNAWQTLTFNFAAAPTPSVEKVHNITGLAIQFAGGGNSTGTWYFDQIYGPNFTVSPGALYEDFEAKRDLTYTLSNGATLTQTQANSAVFGENYSATVGRYARSAVAADVLVATASGKQLGDVATYATAAPTNYLYLKLYSKTIGTPVTLRLQNTAKVGANGAGTQSVFTAATTKSNQWETLRFAYQAASPGVTTDATVSSTQANQLALSFNPGSTVAGQVFDFDFFVGQALVVAVVPAGTAVTKLYDNFEDARQLRFTQTDGTFAPGIDNPSTSGNASTVVGRYVRSANAYDTFEMAPANATFLDDVTGFASTTASGQPSMKLYSTAPVGTTVQMLLLNAAKVVAGGNSYPIGRHSLYTATTTVSGGWQTLSFTYVAGTYDPAVKATEINRIQLQIAPGTTATGTYYFDDITLPSTTLPVARLYENFNDTRSLTYGTADGVLTQSFANPSTTGINPNPSVGKYVRNAGLPYDTFYARFPGTADDIADFANGTRKMTMMVYSPIPVGRPVTITLLDDTFTPGNYPTGRHSFYTANTTAQNAWQKLTFTFVGNPTGGISTVHNITNVAIQFDGGTSSAGTWYFDQLYGPNFTVAPGMVYDDFESTRQLTYTPDGPLTQNASNLSVFGENYSSKVAHYQRAASLYATIVAVPTGGKKLASVATYASAAATKFFYLKIFSKNVGTPVQLVLQNATKAALGYPNGNHSIYNATTTKSNQWETLQFAYQAAAPGSSTDASVSATQVTRFTLLFNPGDATAGQIYDFDFFVGQDLILATGLTWNGSVSTDWNDGDNWSGGTAPVAVQGAPAIIPAGALRYPILTTGNIYGSPDIIINAGGSLTQTGGTFNLANGITNNGIYNQTGGITNLAGTGSHVFGSGNPLTFNDLTVGVGGMNLLGGTNGTVSVRRRMVVAGIVSSNGKLILLSDASGTAMVVNRGTGVINGPVTVQRYVSPSLNSGLGYRHFASPVAGATVADLHGPSQPAPVVNATFNASLTPGLVQPLPTVFTYDEQRLSTATAITSDFSYGWRCPTLADPLAVGVGYAVNLSPTTVSLAGTLRNGSIPITTSRGPLANSGWQFLGNPYPSPINWDSLALPTGVDNALYVARSNSRYGGSYTSYVNNIGPAGANLVAMGGAFFTRVTSGSPTLTFTNAARTVNYTSPVMYRGTSDPRPRLELAVQGRNGENDVLYVYQQAGATPAFDSRFDALKIILNGDQQPTLYQQAGSESLSIQGLPVGTQPVAMPLGVNAPAAGPFSFSAQRLSNFPATATLYLEDTQTGTWHDLRAGTYTATLPQGLHTRRFVLHLYQPRTALATAGSRAALALQAYPNPAQAGTVVQLTMTDKAGTILDLTGRVVGRFADGKVPTAGLAPGLYILRESATGRQARLMVQ